SITRINNKRIGSRSCSNYCTANIESLKTSTAKRHERPTQHPVQGYRSGGLSRRCRRDGNRNQTCCCCCCYRCSSCCCCCCCYTNAPIPGNPRCSNRCTRKSTWTRSGCSYRPCCRATSQRSRGGSTRGAETSGHVSSNGSISKSTSAAV